ncbi:MAG TPA: ParB/RepB/Spo0J family partition protein [Candidatus Limnocylindrales bacterium]|nr:ParB/RepB/Spo0J family partition protein [Candidatus Limnocylindrales bacterium]
MARPDFRAAAARRLSEDRELSPAIVSLLSAESADVGRATGVRVIPVDNIEPNPDQPRMVFDPDALHELAASIREHGVLQPILVRPLGANRYQLVAGERRWRASREAGLETVPALVEDLDDEAALEIAIIENLQREDLSPLEEATMYDRMIHDHGYSIRKLAEKLGKDKGYVENRLRLADAPEEIRDLVSVRKDTLSHAYELLKVTDEKKRRRLAAKVASGELSLVKLRERIEGRPARLAIEGDAAEAYELGAADGSGDMTNGNGHHAEDDGWTGAPRATADLRDDSLVQARHQLADAVEELVGVLRAPDVVSSISDVDRANLAKYLTIAKLKLENAIAMVRSGETD